MKRKLMTFLPVLATGAVLAADGDSFDPTTLITSAQTTVTTIVTAFGALLIAAAAFPLAKLGWRKFKAAISGV